MKMRSNHNTLCAPSKLFLALEIRAIFEIWMLLIAQPIIRFAPKGDGHPIIVFPGFSAGDWATVLLRKFLKGRGYAVHGWNLGFNKGYYAGIEEKLLTRLSDIHQRYNQKVTLIGWSLGGLYARELAHTVPEMVRSVVTLASPFNNVSEGIGISKLYEFVSGQKINQISPKRIQQLKIPPPVPTTSIYSHSDGVVASECCNGIESSYSENIAIPASSHCGIGLNPIVFWIIANRLAQAEDKWRPFNRETMISNLGQHQTEKTLSVV
jgi:hypothetical protein